MYCRYNDACRVGDKLYASACNINGLFSIDIKTYETKYIMRFPHDPFLGVDLHSKVMCRNNTLFFIPLNGTGISVIHLPDYSSIFVASKVKYVNAVMYKNSMYLIPYRLSDGIWEYLIDENILIKTNLNILAHKLSIDNDAITDWYGSLVVNDFLYIVISGTSNVVRVNLITGENKLIQFKETNFANISFIDGWFYITDNQRSCIYKTKMKKNDLLKIELPEEKKTREIYKVIGYNNYIICIPCFGDFIYQYDTDNNNFQILHSIKDKGYIDTNQTKYAGTVIVDGKLILLPKGDFRIVELSMKSIVAYKSYFNNLSDIDNKNDDDIFLYENIIFNLNDYIQII